MSQPSNMGMPTRSSNHQDACVIRASMMSKKFVGAQFMGSLFPFFLIDSLAITPVTNADPVLATNTGAVELVTVETIAPLNRPAPAASPLFFMLWHPTSAAKHRTKHSDKITGRRQVTPPLEQC